MSHEVTLLKIIKRAAIEAFEASKPMACVYGQVVSTAPLTVRVGQTLELGEEHLILTDEVRDHVVERTRIDIVPPVRAKFIEHRALSAGEEVIMLRCAGGQKYIVLCRKGATS